MFVVFFFSYRRRDGPEDWRHERSGQHDLSNIRPDHKRQRQGHGLDGLQNGAGGRAKTAVDDVLDRHRSQSADARRHTAHRHHMPRVIHYCELYVQIRVAVSEMTLYLYCSIVIFFFYLCIICTVYIHRSVNFYVNSLNVLNILRQCLYYDCRLYICLFSIYDKL